MLFPKPATSVEIEEEEIKFYFAANEDGERFIDTIEGQLQYLSENLLSHGSFFVGLLGFILGIFVVIPLSWLKIEFELCRQNFDELFLRVKSLIK